MIDGAGTDQNQPKGRMSYDEIFERRERPGRLDPSMLADLREAHQRLRAINEKLLERRQRRVDGREAEPRG